MQHGIGVRGAAIFGTAAACRRDVGLQRRRRCRPRGLPTTWLRRTIRDEWVIPATQAGSMSPHEDA